MRFSLLGEPFNLESSRECWLDAAKKAIPMIPGDAYLAALHEIERLRKQLNAANQALFEAGQMYAEIQKEHARCPK